MGPRGRLVDLSIGLGGVRLVSVEPCSGVPTGVNPVGRKPFIVVADRIGRVRVLTSVKLDTLRVDHPPPPVVPAHFLGIGSEVFVSHVDRIPKLRIVTEQFDCVGYRFSFDHHPDRHAPADLDKPRFPSASGGVEHRQVIEVEAIEFAGSPGHGLILLELL
jgi:hypothetical protein